METFSKDRGFIETSSFVHARQKSIAALDLSTIDSPIVDIIDGLAALPHCFTLQCCYGHFVCDSEQDTHNLERIPIGFSGSVRYRIAYIAFCLENSDHGRSLRESLAQLVSVDPEYIQFGSPDWFWEQRANSYALQVEPEAHMFKDEAILMSSEAVHTQKVRDLFFEELRALRTDNLVIK